MSGFFSIFVTWNIMYIISSFKLLFSGNLLFLHCIVSAEQSCHQHYKVPHTRCPSAIDVANWGNILEERGCKVCQHQSCFKLNCKVPAEWIAFQIQQAMATHIQSRSESDLIPRAVHGHNPLIDKVKWGEMRVNEKRELSQWRRGKRKKKKPIQPSEGRKKGKGHEKERRTKANGKKTVLMGNKITLWCGQGQVQKIAPRMGSKR